MKSIYKYPLSVEYINSIQFPAGAEILTVQMQDSQPCLWAMINVDDPRIVTRRFLTIGTGLRIDESKNIKYIATYQVPQYSYSIESLKHNAQSTPKEEITGYLVYHIFEELN